MVNTKKLNRRIDESGLKRKFIAKELGVCERTFWAKVQGVSQFKADEQKQLEELLGINSAEEVQELFFEKNVTKN